MDSFHFKRAGVVIMVGLGPGRPKSTHSYDILGNLGLLQSLGLAYLFGIIVKIKWKTVYAALKSKKKKIKDRGDHCIVCVDNH